MLTRCLYVPSLKSVSELALARARVDQRNSFTRLEYVPELLKICVSFGAMTSIPTLPNFH